MLRTDEISEEYIIIEIWFRISNELSFSYILCIVSSLKKNPFIVKYNEKDNRNKDIFNILNYNHC